MAQRIGFHFHGNGQVITIDNKTIAVIGAGSWGTALAVLLAKNGHKVKLWVYDRNDYEAIVKEGENRRYLPGVPIPSNVDIHFNLQDAVEGLRLILLAVPSHVVRETAGKLAGYTGDNPIIINAAKGLEDKTYKRLSQVIEEEIPQARVVVLSGPSHAEEVAQDIPTTVVSSSKDLEAAEQVQDIFMCSSFRVYTNPDLIGVETGGALKNIIALAAGVSAGLGYGDNTKAALMTRGVYEMARLGQALGASALTFAGLSGIGDLIVTCTSMHSRNQRAGILIGKGMPVEQALSEIGMVVEGVRTCKAAYELACSLNIEMPITEQLYQILYKGKDPASVVDDLMLRDKTHESEKLVIP
jgi:glycerol-3-phosphate dehydrogenase (NAD(P)+)